jgi:hypothetical protein
MKLVREHINEKFTKDSDPIRDLGIGDPAVWILEKTPTQDKSDDSEFMIKLSTGNYAVAMGDEFCPEDFDMTLEEMLKFIDKGIKKILKLTKKKLTQNDVGDYSDFFIPEFEDEGEETLTKEYVIAKLICGKENAKWHEENDL